MPAFISYFQKAKVSLLPFRGTRLSTNYFSDDNCSSFASLLRKYGLVLQTLFCIPGKNSIYEYVGCGESIISLMLQFLKIRWRWKQEEKGILFYACQICSLVHCIYDFKWDKKFLLFHYYIVQSYSMPASCICPTMTPVRKHTKMFNNLPLNTTLSIIL